MFAGDAYIESSGAQAISTGYRVNANTKIVVDYQVTDATKKSAPVFGAFDQTSGTAVGLWVNGNGNMEPRLGGWGGGFAKADESRHVVTIDAATLTATYADASGAVSVTKTSANNFAWNGDASEPLWLFASCKDKAVFKGYCRIYSFKIYEGGSLVHDWRPATKGGDIGFYDVKGDGGFIWNGWQPHAALASGGTLLEIEDDAYVSTEGNNQTEGGLFYDTEYYATDKTKIELDYAIQENYSGTVLDGGNGTWYLLSGYGTRWFNFYFNKSMMGWSFGTNSTGGAWCSISTSVFGPPTADKDIRRTVVLDGPAAVAAVVTGGITNVSDSVNHNGNYASYSVKLAAARDGRSSFAPLKIYGCRIWEAGEQVRDFRPVVRGGVAGLKDALSGLFIPAVQKTASGFVTSSGRSGGAIASESDDGYIESDGIKWKWIDTGYTATGATRLEIDFAQTAMMEGYITGTSGGVGPGYLSYSIYTLPPKPASDPMPAPTYAFNCQDTSSNWADTKIAQTFSRKTFVLDGYANAVTVKNAATERSVPFSTTHTASTRWTLPLFSAYDKNGNWQTPLPMKIYGVKIYEGGETEPRKAFVPCVRNGVAGFRETVSGEFVAMDGKSASSLALEAGGSVAVVGGAFDAYIESDGTQAINTGYAVKHGTRVEADFSLRSFVHNARIFSAEDNDTTMHTTVFVQSANPMSLRTSCGDAWQNMVITNLADFGRHTVSVDLTGDNAAYSLSTAGAVAAGGKSAAAATKTAQIPLYLFARNFRNTSKGTSAVDNFASVRLYAFRVYEDGELVHEFLPHKKGDAVGLCDAKTGEVKLDAKGGNALGYGGKGVDGAERWIAEPKGGTITKGTNGDGTRTLKAIVPGAVSYRWTVNGAEAEGGEDGEFTATWQRRGTTDVYAVYPIYSVFGETVEGEPRTAEIRSVPAGTVIIIR